MRAPFQVLVIPYKIINNEILYGIFLRSDMKVWQTISGGGEDDESPIEAAKREANEEAGIDIVLTILSWIALVLYQSNLLQENSLGEKMYMF